MSSGLSSDQLSRIWSEVDRDGDGKISMSEFSAIMSRVRLERSTNSLQVSAISLPSGELEVVVEDCVARGSHA